MQEKQLIIPNRSKSALTLFYDPLLKMLFKITNLDLQTQFSIKVAIATLSLYYMSLTTYYVHNGYTRNLIGIFNDYSPISYQTKKETEKLTFQNVITKIREKINL
eukprot:gene5687-9508_t